MWVNTRHLHVLGSPLAPPMLVMPILPEIRAKPKAKVPGDAPAGVEHGPNAKLRQAASLGCRLSKPPQGFGVALLGTGAVVKHAADVRLGLVVALVRWL